MSSLSLLPLEAALFCPLLQGKKGRWKTFFKNWSEESGKNSLPGRKKEIKMGELEDKVKVSYFYLLF